MDNEHQHRGRPVRIWKLGIPVLVIAIVLLAIGIIPRISQNAELNASAAAVKKAGVIVEVAKPTQAPKFSTVDLPGTVEAAEQTGVIARATGYADKVLVNIGDHVNAGQTLALITSPDTDQEYFQGRAQLTQAQGAVTQALSTVASSQQTVAQDQALVSHDRAAQLNAQATDQQVRYQLNQAQQAEYEAQATLAADVANEHLAKLTNDRYQKLAQQGYAPQATADQDEAAYETATETSKSAQNAVDAAVAGVEAQKQAVDASDQAVSEAKYDVDSAIAAVSAAQETVNSNRAAVSQAQSNVGASGELERLGDLQGFEKVVAPFSGVITARNIDPGAYVSGGGSATGSTLGSSTAGASNTGSTASGSASLGSSSSSGSSSSALFTVATLDSLRVYVNVPEGDVAELKEGQKAAVTVSAIPGKTFDGIVGHSATALDPGSRTLVVEIDLPNQSSLLRPGMFTTVELKIPQPSGVLLVPDSALVTDTNGTQVIIVQPDHTLHYQSVDIGNDDGKNMEILNGVAPDDQVVTAPSNGLTEGEKVKVKQRIKNAPGTPTPGGAAGGQQGKPAA